MSNNAKPENKIRYQNLAVTIWKNTGEKGPWYSVTPSRRYKQEEEGRDSDRFGQDDLLLLAQLLQEAHAWIRNAEQSARKAA